MADTAFRDNVVIVTGASSGIGRSLALQLAQQGARLTLAARDGARLEQVAAECHRSARDVLVVPTDVSERAQCEHLIARAVDAFGRIDTLINNAGISMSARFDELRELAVLERLMRVNYFGSVHCTYYALPHLKRTRGRIVAVVSLTGKAGVPTRSGYAASKHAMAGLFDSIRIELADHGVGVTTVYPGFVATEARRHALGPDGQPLQTSPVREHEVMTADACAAVILRAAARRTREVVMTPRGKVGMWLKLVAPALLDRIVRKAIERGR